MRCWRLNPGPPSHILINELHLKPTDTSRVVFDQLSRHHGLIKLLGTVSPRRLLIDLCLLEFYLLFMVVGIIPVHWDAGQDLPNLNNILYCWVLNDQDGNSFGSHVMKTSPERINLETSRRMVSETGAEMRFLSLSILKPWVGWTDLICPSGLRRASNEESRHARNKSKRLQR